METLQFFDAEGEQLLGLSLCMQPVLGRLKISSAFFAPQDSCLLLDAFGDIDLRAKAVDTHI